MKKALLLIMVCFCMVILCACGASEALQETIDSIDQEFSDTFNTSNSKYLGYVIDGKTISFNITYDGAAVYYLLGTDMTDVESVIDDVCNDIYQQLKGYKYNACINLQNDMGGGNEDGLLYSSLNGEKSYSIADIIQQ